MYTVNIWGSKPGTNDDCWTGADYANKAEALKAYADPASISDYIRRVVTVGTSELWVEIDGPEVHEERQLRKGRANRQAQEQHELAMEAGMGFGIDAYNDAMGWGA